ncbi:MAG: hypothetical protein Q4A52_03400, partial [Bacillota bacterium]|nr:hypothetical protein [Bacillota bacterium]
MPSTPRIIGSSNFGSDDGMPEEAEFRSPKGMDFWAMKGLVVVADSGNHQIRTIDPENGHVATLAGDASVPDAMGHPIGGYVD